MSTWKAFGLALLAAGLCLLAIGAPVAAAAGLATRLASAEATVYQDESERPALRAGIAVAEDNYRAAAHRAAPPVRSLHQAEAQARHLHGELAAREQKARADITRLEERHQAEVDDHDEEVRSGVGFGFAALVAGLIALAWGWFRAAAAVAALTRIDRGQAIGICVGGGLLLLIVGAVLGSSNGATGALGSFLFCLGLILPTAFLLARHSAEIQRGREKPLLRRERLPQWASQATAGLMFVLFLAGAGSAAFATGASSAPIIPRLEGEAEAVREGRGAGELQAAEMQRTQAKQRAAAPLAARAKARRELASARRELRHAQQRLAGPRRGSARWATGFVPSKSRSSTNAKWKKHVLSAKKQSESKRKNKQGENLPDATTPTTGHVFRWPPTTTAPAVAETVRITLRAPSK